MDGSGVISLGLDGKKLEPESNVLLASIENMQSAVTLEVLQMVFSAFGPVQKIAMFDKNGELQALIQYPDVPTAVVAKEAHCSYDGGFCKLHITYSRHTDLSIKVNNDRSRDYTLGSAVMVNPQPSVLGQQPGGPMGGGYPYNGGAQYAPPPVEQQQAGMSHNPMGGWAPPQSVPMQQPMNNNHHPYMHHGMPPQMGGGGGAMPPQQMNHGMMHQGGPPPPSPYGRGQ